MFTRVVVAVKKSRECASSVMRGGVWFCVSPFAEQSLDEAFSFSIGLRSIGSGEALADAQLCAGLLKEIRREAASVVGDDFPDLNSERTEPLDGTLKELGGTELIFAGKNLYVCQPGVIVDGDMSIFPTDIEGVLSANPCDAVPGGFVFVASYDALGEPAQTIQSKPTKSTRYS